MPDDKYEPFSLFETYLSAAPDKKGHIFTRKAGQDAAQFVLGSYDEMVASDRTVLRHPYMYELPRGLSGGYQHYFQIKYNKRKMMRAKVGDLCREIVFKKGKYLPILK